MAFFSLRFFTTSIKKIIPGPFGLVSRTKNEAKIFPGERLLKSLVVTTNQGRSINLLNEAKEIRLAIFVYPGYREGLRFGELAGCTKQACSINRALGQLQKHNIEVFSLTTQSKELVSRYVEEQHIDYEVLLDPNHTLINYFGVEVWRNGREQFPVRSTILIEKGGVYNNTLEVTDIDSHIEEVIQSFETGPLPSCSFGSCK